MSIILLGLVVEVRKFLLHDMTTKMVASTTRHSPKRRSQSALVMNWLVLAAVGCSSSYSVRM
ncbi:hypothetical protein [Chroococcidiopsis sp.]|uniref:hypothetical protein n=1 Tax=Chroococcidiopsis sp. TaxID=3088168 RepID=UPI003F2F46A3